LSSKGTTVVGLVVAILIVGAIASIGYYQLGVAKVPTTSSASNTVSQVTCTKTNCAYVNITAGAGGCILPTVCGFSPASITVVIGVNNTVVWTNDDTATHTITPLTGAAWDTIDTCQGIPGLCQGVTFQYTFTASGTYQYHCLYHNGMQGTVIVKSH